MSILYQTNSSSGTFQGVNARNSGCSKTLESRSSDALSIGSTCFSTKRSLIPIQFPECATRKTTTRLSQCLSPQGNHQRSGSLPDRHGMIQSLLLAAMWNSARGNNVNLLLSLFCILMQQAALSSLPMIATRRTGFSILLRWFHFLPKNLSKDQVQTLLTWRISEQLFLSFVSSVTCQSLASLLPFDDETFYVCMCYVKSLIVSLDF